MKNLFLVTVFLLSTGAFLNFWITDATSLSTTLRGDVHLQWMWAAIDVIILLFCFRHARQLIAVAKKQFPVLLFVCWGAMSIFWSLDPELSARRLLGLICTTAFGFYLGLQFSMTKLLRLLGVTLAIAVIASILVEISFRWAGVGSGSMLEAWRGIYETKNTMARIMGLGCFSFLCLFLSSERKRSWYLVWMIGALTLIALSQSITAVLVTAITCAIGFWHRLHLKPAAAIAGIAALCLLGVVGAASLAGDTDAMFRFLGRDSTLTGRTYLWQLSLDAALRRPILGAGWDVFWGTAEADRIRSLVGWDAPHGHNAFLDLWLDTGIIGVTLFLIALLDCTRRAMRYNNANSRAPEWPLMFYSFMFFYMFTETALVDRHSIFQIMFCAISVALRAQERSETYERSRFSLANSFLLQARNRHSDVMRAGRTYFAPPL
jgi:exopolysaccharide production protein ExoQ